MELFKRKREKAILAKYVRLRAIFRFLVTYLVIYLFYCCYLSGLVFVF